jgi:hypothetical protein
MVEQEHGYVKHGDTSARPAGQVKGEISKMFLKTSIAGFPEYVKKRHFQAKNNVFRSRSTPNCH